MRITQDWTPVSDFVTVAMHSIEYCETLDQTLFSLVWLEYLIAETNQKPMKLAIKLLGSYPSHQMRG